MKKLCLCLVLLLLLSGCGSRSLDPETAALADSSDAVCRVNIVDIFDEADETGAAVGSILYCRVLTDYLGSLTERGTELESYDRQFIFLRVSGEWRQEFYAWRRDPESAGKAMNLLVFLNATEERREWISPWKDGVSGEFMVFVPNGEAGLRWEPADREGLRYLEALRAYGKAHPRAPLGDWICWTGWITF